MRRMGIAADHGGFALKEAITQSLRSRGYDIVDFGAHQLNPTDDYPEVIVPLARAIAAGQLEHVVALCGSGALRHRRRLAELQALEHEET